MGNRRALRIELPIAAALIAFVVLLTYIVFTSAVHTNNWHEVYKYRSYYIRGFFVTTSVSILALFLSSVVAVMLVVGQRVGSLVLKRACQGYIELVRGTPLLVQILVVNYVIGPAFGVTIPLILGVVALALFSAAYLAEIIRGGVESIASSQKEAAAAVGFTSWQTYRLVIVPQTIRRILPGVAGEFANLIKNSSLMSVISVSELTKLATDILQITYGSMVEVYLPLTVAYLLLTIPIGLMSRFLERRFSYEY